MLVYVLNKNNVPLMPCSPRKSRILLKEGKATVVKRTPFTIKLKYGSSGYKQEITLGVDAGSKMIGLSATTEKKELFAGECNLRNDIVRLLSSRSQREWHEEDKRRDTGNQDSSIGFQRRKMVGWLLLSLTKFRLT